MTMPKPVIARIVRNRAQSVLSLAMRTLLYQTFELASAVLEVFKLVEARAGRREQYGIPRARPRTGFADSRLQRAASDHRRGASQLIFDLFRGRSDQQRRLRLLPKRLLQRRVVGILVLAAQNHP